jgi:putative spermidine/putrescine transport system permease protein
VLSGDVSSSPQTGAALSVGMIVVMVGVLMISAAFSRRASRWHK